MADVIFMKSGRDLRAVLRCFTTRREFISVEIVVENRDEAEASCISFSEIHKVYIESFKYCNDNPFASYYLSQLTFFQRKNT